MGIKYLNICYRYHSFKYMLWVTIIKTYVMGSNHLNISYG